jgi:hypothetical protein
MTAPLPWRVFRLNDCDWWVARTLDEAKEDAARTWGFRYVEDAENVFEEPQELDDATLDRLHFIDTDERERPVKTSRRTFRAELAQRVAAGLSKPELFACTEY